MLFSGGPSVWIAWQLAFHVGFYPDVWPVTIDIEETLAARQKFPVFNEIVVGTFDGSVALYRGV